MGWDRTWAPYKPVAQRRREAEQAAKRLMKKGQTLCPIQISGRAIATTFWGKAWCEHLEQYSDFSNRLPRGRTYARNGSVVDLQITPGKITALVSGSSLYRIAITIKQIEKARWKRICSDSANSIHSLIDLMLGKLSSDILERLTEPTSGMFPSSRDIKMSCSCPDGARLCKHLAAVLYGIGHRLDSAPELLFVLRGVDQRELIAESISTSSASAAMGLEQPSTMLGEDLETIFGIDLAATPAPQPVKKAARQPKRSVVKKAEKSTAVSKQARNKAVIAKPPASKGRKKASQAQPTSPRNPKISTATKSKSIVKKRKKRETADC